MISVLIVDDHPLIADGISVMLQEHEYYQIVGSCKTGKEFLELSSSNTPDIILLDINLPDIDGIKLCEQIRKDNKDTKIIMLTSINEAAIISRVLNAGANGYLLKNMDKEELLNAFNLVSEGKIALSKSANEKLLESYTSVNSATRNNKIIITRRELEILKLLEEGKSGPQIADSLKISPLTVETHRKNLMQKFKVSTTVLLLKTAKEQMYL